jgi:hypothetical protein
MVAGFQDDPDKIHETQTGQINEQQTTFAPASAEELQMQQASLQNYLQQQALAQQFEGGMAGRQGIQDAAQAQALGIINGQGMNVTEQEAAAIEQQRQAYMGNATADVNKMLDQRLQGISQSAGERGIRGQAMSELQGRALTAGAEQYGAASRAAAAQAAQQTMQTPYQRIAAQSPYVMQGATFADMMNAQAQQNRMNAQNPALMQMLNRERLMAGNTVTKNTRNNKEIDRGEKGSWGRALLGNLSGAAAGYNGGSGGSGWDSGNSGSGTKGGGGGGKYSSPGGSGGGGGGSAGGFGGFSGGAEEAPAM